jgi:hypothetical protein
MKTSLICQKLILPISLILSLTAAAAPQKTVCTMTINSSDEKEAFVKNLSAKDFKFVELTKFDDPKQGADRSTSKWFENACQAQVQCDILVVSAHFGGMFFGSSGYHLSMEPLEKNSCSNSCDGILKHPKEVFLFGCNTLAEKNKDHRTQEQYTQILVQDGIGRVQAERIAETRYGAVGSTFKDRMRRVFQGVPHIYGFSSTAPAGSTIRPDLNDYFQKIPDYSIHLQSMNDASEKNEQLLRSLSGTSISESSGVGTIQNDAAIPYRQQICATYDTQTSIADRTKIITGMLMGPDRLIYLNSVVAFLKRYEEAVQQDKKSQAWMKKIISDKTTMDELDRLRLAPSTSVALKLDLLHLDVQLGRRSQQDFEKESISILKNLLHPLNQGNADLVCSSLRDHGLSLQVSFDDFSGEDLNSSAAVYAMGCLSTTDERITSALLPLGMNPKFIRNGNDLRAYLLTLAALPGQPEQKLEIGRFISEYTKHFKVSYFDPFILGLMISAGDEKTAIDYLLQLQKLDLTNAYMVFEKLARLGPKKELSSALIKTLTLENGQQYFYAQAFAILGTLADDQAVGNELINRLSSVPTAILSPIFLKAANLSLKNSKLINFALMRLAADQGYSAYPAYFLAQSVLSPTQLEELTKIVSKTMSLQVEGLGKWILSSQPVSHLSEKQRKKASGTGYQAVCESITQSYQCALAEVKLSF